MFRKKPGSAAVQSMNALRKADSATLESSTDGADAVRLPPQVEKVLELIKSGWDFMSNDDFNPVTLALELLDTTSQSRQLDDFFSLMDRLDKAMQIIVDDHYQAFNNSIETFSRVTDSISDSRKRVEQLRSNLIKCQNYLQTKRPDLYNLWLKSVQYKEMLKMLETVETLENAPERIEQLIQDKYYLSAVKELLSSLETMASGGYAEIKALSDIRSRLSDVKATLHEKIMEDLHSVIYLRFPQSNLVQISVTPISESTSSLNSGMNNIPAPARRDILTSHSTLTTPNSSSYVPTHKKAASDDFKGPPSMRRQSFDRMQHKKSPSDEKRAPTAEEQQQQLYSGITMVFEDLEADPRDDPLNFMETMLTALDLLGKLNDTVDFVKQQVPFELYKITTAVVDSCETKWKEKCEVGRQNDSHTRLTLIKDGVEVEILKQFLKELFNKFLRITEMHRLTIASFQRVLQRSTADKNGVQKISFESKFIRYSLVDLWGVMQAEIMNVLSVYLTSKEPTFVSNTMTTSLSESGRFQQKSMFKFSESQIAKTKSTQPVDSKDSHLGVADMLMSKNNSSLHKLSIQPSIFFISSVFRPTFLFVEKMEKILKLRTDKRCAITMLLEGLLLKNLVPQIEDIISQRFNENMNAIDSFKPTVNLQMGRESTVSVVRAVEHIIDLVKDVCLSVHNIPVYQKEFVRIFEKLIVRFYEKLLAKFKTSISVQIADSSEKSILSVKWTQSSELIDMLKQNSYFRGRDAIHSSMENLDLAEREYSLVATLRNRQPVDKAYIISDPAKLAFFAYLRTSILQFIKHTKSFVKIEHDPTEPHISIRSFSDVLEIEIDENDAHKANDYTQKSVKDILKSAVCVVYNEEGFRYAYLIFLIYRGPLSHTVFYRRLNGYLKAYQSLADHCLFLMRKELHAHCYYYLELSLSEGNYQPDTNPSEPETYILMLNSDLMMFHRTIYKALPLNERLFIFDGIHIIINNALIEGAKMHQINNKNGILRMIKNILALQQCINAICGSSENYLDNSKKFYESSLKYLTNKPIVK